MKAAAELDAARATSRAGEETMKKSHPIYRVALFMVKLRDVKGGGGRQARRDT